MKGVMDNDGETDFNIVDRLRGIGDGPTVVDAEGYAGDTCESGSDIVDGE